MSALLILAAGIFAVLAMLWLSASLILNKLAPPNASP